MAPVREHPSSQSTTTWDTGTLFMILDYTETSRYIGLLPAQPLVPLKEEEAHVTIRALVLWSSEF